MFIDDPTKRFVNLVGSLLKSIDVVDKLVGFRVVRPRWHGGTIISKSISRLTHPTPPIAQTTLDITLVQLQGLETEQIVCILKKSPGRRGAHKLD